MRRRDSLLALAVLAAGAAAPAQTVAARVAAASDLQFALPEVVAAFHKTGAHRVEPTFGASGNFARQIQQGAGFELFLSADEGFVHRLADAGLTRDRGSLYAIGHIVLIAPAASTLPLDPGLEGLRREWSRIRRFAIANPEHAPYGRAARQALEKLGQWEQVQDRLVLGENISQATQYVSTGAADAGITALSLALAPPVAAQTRHVALPESLHAPLRQRMVLLKGAGAAAIAFHDFLSSAEARALLSRHGFAAPSA